MDSPLGAPGGLAGSLVVQLCIAGVQLALPGVQIRLNPFFDISFMCAAAPVRMPPASALLVL
jgi:hypothetical protein